MTIVTSAEILKNTKQYLIDKFQTLTPEQKQQNKEVLTAIQQAQSVKEVWLAIKPVNHLLYPKK